MKCLGFAIFLTVMTSGLGNLPCAQADDYAGTEGNTAGASAGPATGKQAETSYRKGMAVFVHTTGGLMHEAAVGDQKFSFDPTK